MHGPSARSQRDRWVGTISAGAGSGAGRIQVPSVVGRVTMAGMVPLFHVDAFTSEPFSGNPAAVCLLDEPADPPWMQAVAGEMNLSETAFFTPGHELSLRWFTPTTEVPLCGHATLATAHVLWSQGITAADTITFETLSGTLTATRQGEWMALDLPALPADECPLPAEVLQALGVDAVRTGRSTTFDVVEVRTEAEVTGARPDLARLGDVERGYIVTAPAGTDAVCRVFAPGLGIPEDPATGSAQCVLGPWWASRLGGPELTVRQISRRGGILRVRTGAERVMVSGQAVTTARGTLLS